jgi:hypothetical protein
VLALATAQEVQEELKGQRQLQQELNLEIQRQGHRAFESGERGLISNKRKTTRDATKLSVLLVHEARLSLEGALKCCIECNSTSATLAGPASGATAADVISASNIWTPAGRQMLHWVLSKLRKQEHVLAMQHHQNVLHHEIICGP